MTQEDERELAYFTVQALEQTDRRENIMDLMNTIIDLNPHLSKEERRSFCTVYKNAIDVHRNGIKIIEGLIMMDKDKKELNQNRKEQVEKVRNEISDDIEKICKTVIEIIDSKLIPASEDSENKIFYEKLKADYYRYMCEIKTGELRKPYIEKARNCYQSALKLAKTEIKKGSPLYLGLILNYTIFLYEILNQKKEAVEIVRETYHECRSLIDQNSNDSLSEATLYFTFLHQNLQIWSDDYTL